MIVQTKGQSVTCIAVRHCRRILGVAIMGVLTAPAPVSALATLPSKLRPLGTASSRLRRRRIDLGDGKRGTFE